MTLIDRYLFRQFFWPALAVSAALIALGVLSQSLTALNVLVNQRQSAVVFAKLIVLALPQIIVLVLPVALLVSALIALSRLHGEHEIAICYGAGISRARVIAPAMELAALATALSLLLSLFVQPLAFREMRDTLERVRADLAATLIRPGQFNHPAPGLTVYAQAVDDDGAIHNLFIDKVSRDGRDTTITAREGRMEKRAGGPMLVVRQGANQQFSPAGVLNFLSFDQYVVDLRPLMSLGGAIRYKLSDRYPHELFYPDPSDDWAWRNADKLLAEGHSRIAAPLYNLAFMALALAALLGGASDRRGYGARIAVAAAVALGVRTAGFAIQAVAANLPALNAAQYVVPIGALAGALAVIFSLDRMRKVAPAR